MDTLGLTSHKARKARTRSLVQLGALVSTAGLIKTFDITLGKDLQRDPEMRDQIAALFKGFLVLNEMVESGEAHLPLWTKQGLEELDKLKNHKKNTPMPGKHTH